MKTNQQRSASLEERRVSELSATGRPGKMPGGLEALLAQLVFVGVILLLCLLPSFFVHPEGRAIVLIVLCASSIAFASLKLVRWWQMRYHIPEAEIPNKAVESIKEVRTGWTSLRAEGDPLTDRLLLYGLMGTIALVFLFMMAYTAWGFEEAANRVGLLVACSIILAGLFCIVLRPGYCNFMRLFVVGDTTVEVSQPNFVPGSTVGFRIIHHGSIKIKSAFLRLQFVERMRRDSGTVLEHVAIEERLVDMENVLVHSLPFSIGEFKIPESGSPSFRGSKCGLLWRLRLSVCLPWGVSFEEDYLLKVHPQIGDCYRTNRDEIVLMSYPNQTVKANV